MVFGLGRLRAGSEKRVQAAEDPVQNGLKRMKELGLPGLVIVAPKDETRRRELGRGLFRLVRGLPSPHDREFGPEFQAAERRAQAFCWTCVIICLEQDEARGHFGESSPRMVIDETGKVLRRVDDPPASVEPNLAKRLMDLVHGAKLEHLKRRVAQQRRTLPGDMDLECKSFLDDLAEREAPSSSIPRTAEYKELLKRARGYLAREPKLSGWFGLTLLEISAEEQTVLDALFWSLHKDRLPLGTYMPRFVDRGCMDFAEVKPGEPEPQGNSMIYCGMPSLSSTGGRFLRFVGKAR